VLTAGEKAAKAKVLHVRFYSVDELKALYAHAPPMVRLLLLLGLNCGHQQADFGQLLEDEVYFDEVHPHARELGYDAGNRCSWVKRVRIKTGVYGEFKLWDHTARGLLWAVRRKRRIGSTEKCLLVTDSGESLTKPTKAGNKPSRVLNHWKKLLATVEEAGVAVPVLPVKYLRKMGGELVRRKAGGEVAGVSLCHGTPVKTDALLDLYTNRPFGEVFHALDRIEDDLKPVFDAVPDPFPE
jgi:hypothetical protein